MKYIFILFLILSLTTKAFCQGQDSSRVQNMIALGEYDGIKISVDNNFFTSKNDSIVSLLYKNFIENIPVKYWKFETIKPASNLSQIIKENYDIYDNGENSFDETYQLLKGAIATKSKLKNENKIIAGDSLLLPPVPSKRNRMSNDEISKLFEEFEVKTAIPYVALDSFGKPITKIKWHSINIKQKNILKTLSKVSNIDKIKYFDFTTISNSSDSIYIADIDFFNFKESFTSLEIKPNLNFSFNSKTIDKVKTINEEIGEYIIVDDFGSYNNCLHGDKVYSVDLQQKTGL